MVKEGSASRPPNNNERIQFLEGRIAELEKALHSAIEANHQSLSPGTIIDHRLANTTGGFIKLDDDFSIISVNELALEFLKEQPAEVLGKSLDEIFPVVARKIRANLFARDQDAAASFETYFPALDRWAEVYTFKIDDCFAVHIRDITAHKKAEEELSYQAQILQNVNDAIIATDVEERITAWNKAAETLLGWQSSEVLGKQLNQVIHFEMDDHIQRDTLKIMAESSSYRFKSILYTRQGRPIEVDTSTMILRDPEGKISGSVSVYHDITFRKRSEDLLRKSEQSSRELAAELQLNLDKLNAVIHSMVEAVIIADPLGRILTMNPAALSMHGFTREAPSVHTIRELGQLFTSYYPDGSPVFPADWPAVRAAQGDEITALEITAVRNQDGKVGNWLYNAIPVRNPAGEIILIVVTIFDLTVQRRSAAQLETQRLIMKFREEERVKIAQDIHDGPLQDVMALNFGLSEALRVDDKEQRLAMLASVRGSLQQVSHELRTFCTDLRPPALAPFGLEKAIQSHIQSFQAAHPEIECQVELMPDGQTLPEYERLALYRIYQELMINVIKHARASQVSVRLTLDEAQTELEVQDNGEGFSLPEEWLELAHTGHFGLVGIRERVEALNGRVLIRSRAGEGTLVRAILPRLTNREDRPGPSQEIG